MNGLNPAPRPRTIVRGCLVYLAATLLAACAATGPAQATATAQASTSGPGVTAPAPTASPEASTPPATIEPSSTKTATTVYLPVITQTAPAPAGLPDGASAQWVSVASGLTGPVGIANAGDGSGRLFIIERVGRIRILSAGQIVPAAYLDISGRVGSAGSEQGLLGLAFHPDFRQNGYFYVNYTDPSGNTVIARYHADPQAAAADPASEKVLLRQAQPFANHNGGSMVFGPDGLLYMGLGDGGSAGDPLNNAPNSNTLLGKLLRVNVDQGDPYSIPADNPYASGGGKPEIWALGLRNPWRFDFDPQTGDLYIGDVGQDTWEEIDYLPAGSPAGANFGWSYREGAHDYKGNVPAGLSLVEPVYEYNHTLGCSVTGGVIYRGAALPAWQGVYLFADYCRGTVWGLRHQPDGSWLGQALFETGYSVTAFGRDEQGEVYLVDQRGTLARLEPK